MRTMNTALIPLFAMAMAVLPACGGDSDVTPEEYDDVAASVGALVADGQGSEMEAARDTIEAAEGEVPSGLTRDGPGAIRGRRGSLDYSFEVTCVDAAGATLETCDATTDTAQLVLSWNGEVDTPRYDASVVRTGDWQLTNVQGDEAELNGTGTFDVMSEFVALFRNEMRTYRLDYDADYDAVKIRTSDRRPVAGSIVYSISAERTASRQFRDVERSFDVTAVVTFRGDASALVEFDGQRTYQVDLTTGDVELQ